MSLPKEWLIDYACGGQSEAFAALTAAHLTLSPRVRQEMRAAEAVGGVLLDGIEPVPLSEHAREDVFNDLAGGGGRDGDIEQASMAADPLTVGLPRPLASFLASRGGSLRWKWRYPGVREADLGCDSFGNHAHFLLIGKGRKVPQHAHGGREATLVLEGGFSDVNGHYVRGDVCLAEANVEHQPVADRDGPCLCFAVSEAPLQLTGPIGRYLSHFLKS